MPEVKFQCQSCDRSFKTALALRAHSRAHSKTKDSSFSCKECASNFVLKRELNYHVDYECNGGKKNSRHSRDSKLSDIKEKLEAQPASKESIIDMNETIFNSVVTPLNGEALNFGLVSDRERFSFDERKKTFNCHVCEKSFANRFNLSVHIKVHYSKKKSDVFSCHTCNVQFKQHIALRKHLRSLDHQRRKFTELDKISPLPAMPVTYECLICEKHFETKQELAKHSNSHSNGQEISCDLCEQSSLSRPKDKSHRNPRHFKSDGFLRGPTDIIIFTLILNKLNDNNSAMDIPKSKEASLLELIQRTGCNMIQENGQRLFGPPPTWEGPPPTKGCEVFVGKIPRDLYEDELVPVFETVGPIYQLRLMMEYSNTNRGFAFVMYGKPEHAKKAVQLLDNYEIRRGKFIGVCKSVDNCRLFVGGIPKTKGREEILAEMEKITEDVVDVILYPSVVDKTKNRGFAFVEYGNHRAAAMARRKLIPGKVQLFGHEIAVDWAEPEPDVDEETMNKVTILYVRNLMLSTTEEQIRDYFAVNGSLKIEKVKKLRDFAFVHYRSREEAEEALETLDKSELDGAIIDVTWAKPADLVKKRGGRQLLTSVPVTPVMYMPPGYEMPSLANYAVANANNIAAGGMVVPRVSVRGRSRGAAGLRTGRGASIQGYRAPLYRSVKSYEILQELCQKNNWGEPVFQLLSTGGNTESDVQLFNFKVTLPGLTSPYNTFSPPKLCQYMEEAKQYAAEYVLTQLGITLDNVEHVFSGYAMPVAATNTPTTSATANSNSGNFNRMSFLGGPAAYAEFYEMPHPPMF